MCSVSDYVTVCATAETYYVLLIAVCWYVISQQKLLKGLKGMGGSKS